MDGCAVKPVLSSHCPNAIKHSMWLATLVLVGRSHDSVASDNVFINKEHKDSSQHCLRKAQPPGPY